jgi:hypothetical protein
MAPLNIETMWTKDNLEKWFEDLNRIIFDINISIDNIKRIATTEDEFEKQIIEHGFFGHFYRQSRFTIIVQLCKIFAENNNQKRNLYKLFNKLTFDKYDSDIQQQLYKNKDIDRLFSSRTDIQNEIIGIKTEISKHSDLIKKIVTLRDKYYAHSDTDSDLPKVSNAELEVLVKLAVKIYNKIRGGFFDVTFMFDSNADWKVDYPLKVLAAHRKEQLERIKRRTE